MLAHCGARALREMENSALMLKSLLKRYFAAPSFSAPFAEEMTAFTQAIMRITVLITVAVTLTSFALLPDFRLRDMTPHALIIMLQGFTLLLVSTRPRVAGWLMLCVTWGGLLWVAVFVPPLATLSLVLVPCGVLVTGMLTGRWGTLLTGAVLAVAMFAALFVPQAWLSPSLMSVPRALWVAVGMASAVVGGLMYYGIYNFQLAIQAVYDNKDHLARTLTELKDTTVSTVYMNSILQAMQDMLIVVDAQLEITTVNRAVLETLGYQEHKLIAKPLRYLLRTMPPTLEADLQALFAHERDAIELPLFLITQNDKVLEVRFTARRIDADVPAPQVVCVMQDITEKARAEKKINQEHMLLRTVIDNLPDFIYVKDMQGRFLVSNRRNTERYGLRYEYELLHKRVQDIEPNADLADAISREEQRVLANVPIVNQTGTLLMPDRTRREIQIYKYPLRNPEDEIIGLVAVLRDVTETVKAQRIMSQERNLLRTIMDSLPDYVHVKDTSGRYLLANRAYLERINCRLSDIEGKTAQEIHSHRTLHEEENDENYILETGYSVSSVERIAYDARGNQLWVLVNKVPLYNNNGSLIGFVSVETDITERRKNEESSRISEERLRSVLQNAPVFIFAIDSEQNLMFFDGRGNTDVDKIGVALGKALFQENHDNADLHIAGDVRRAFNGEPSQSLVKVEAQAFDIRYSPVVDKGGYITSVIGVATDITERIDAERQLRETEAQNRALLEALPDMVFVLDGNGRTLTIKAEHSDELLMPRDEMIGKTLLEVFPERESALAYIEKIRLCLQTDEMQAFDYDLTTPTGTYTFEARIAKLNANEVVSVVRNVTENRLAQQEIHRREQMYRKLARNLPSTTVLLYDQRLKVLIAEGEVLQQAGIQRAQIEAQNINDLVREIPQHVLDTLTSEVLQRTTGALRVGLHTPTSTEFTFGERAYVLSTLPLYTPEQEMDEGMAVIRDVTDERKRTAELYYLLAELERSNSELQDFAYAASHDLQEPLRKIQTFGDQLRLRAQDSLDETSQDYLDRMQKAAVRMQQLIQDLLAFSRVTTRAAPFRAVNLQRVLEGVLSDLEVRIAQTAATLDIDPLPVIDAEETQMRQLLQNLIGNALKYSKPDTAPHLTLRVHYEGAKNLIVCLTLCDNGIGFDNKYSERIFGMFQRLHTRQAYEGTGMGLAICRKIVERHNGSIVASGTEGEGACFAVRLPVTQPQQTLTSESLR